ncbi:carboxypeptidase-like regulatory domain-containing protein, partial [Streptomyces sp. NPDC088178]
MAAGLPAAQAATGAEAAAPGTVATATHPGGGLAASSVGSHGEISGAVTDSSGKALSGASVVAGIYRSTTDAQGHYNLTVPPDTYKMAAYAYGYAPKKANGVVVDDGTVTMDFA